MHQPIAPSSAYLDRASASIAQKVANAAPAAQLEPAYPGHEQVWDAAAAEVESLREDLEFVVHDLHAHPETAFAEHRSMNALADMAEKHGFAAQRGVFGLETAFMAEVASDDFDPGRHPSVAVMAEYDALPGIGHACGHNIIAAAGLGAFIAAARVLAHRNISGRLVLLGTPAEEGHTGKEYLIRGGALEGIDAAVMVHGFGYDIASHAWVGRRTVTATFRGVAAHASAQPFMGRNALDAASLAYQGLGLLRQQMPPGDRLHAVITDGGRRPSVIPDASTLELYVRSGEVDTLLDLSARVNDVLEGAALMAGCRVEVTWDRHPMSLPVRNNEVMADRWARTQARRERTALPAGVVPDTLAASTDFGNVSHLIPGIHPMIKVSPDDVALHTQDFARWANSPAACAAAADAACGLAQVSLDFLADAHMRDAALAEFAAAGGPVSLSDLVES